MMKTKKKQVQKSVSSRESAGPDLSGSSSNNNATTSGEGNLAKQPELIPMENHYLTTILEIIYLFWPVNQQEITTIMSRRQQTIANITDQFFFDDDVYSNELSRDRRRYLNDEIAYLKLQLLYNAIMQGISHHESSDKAKRFTAVPLKLERAQKAFKILFGQDTTLDYRLTWLVGTQNYGRNQADIKEEAREKLEHLLYGKANSFELFIENFQELKAQAEITDEDDCLVRYLFRALPQALDQATKFYFSDNAGKDEITADFGGIKKVIATSEALFQQK
ncbi:hypothetical protein G6F42_021986 [Rhizopus arrhizus]|nr:hypothetical protein G6F42_021986 [Rhizopus arrhizus]